MGIVIILIVICLAVLLAVLRLSGLCSTQEDADETARIVAGIVERQE